LKEEAKEKKEVDKEIIVKELTEEELKKLERDEILSKN